MRSLALVFALTLAAAGCLAPAASKLAPAAATTAPGLGFAVLPHVVNPAGGEGEPSLGIGLDGALYTDGPRAKQADDVATNAGTVYKSTDGGATWKDAGSPTETPNLDPDLAMSHDGVLWWSSLWLGCSSAGASKDGGKTWTTSVAACFPPAGDRQYVVPEGGCDAVIYSHHVPTLEQMVATTSDCGATWTPVGSSEGLTSPVGGGSSWGGGGYWNAAKDGVHLTWTWYDSTVDAQTGPQTTAAHAADAHTSDGGATWTQTLAPSAGGAPLGLGLVMGAADKAGNDYLTWGEAKGQDVAIYLAVSRDDGKTWSKPVLVDGDATSKVFPAIAALDEGRVAVAYYHADQHGYPSGVPKGTHWNVTLAWTANALGDAACAASSSSAAACGADAPTFERANLSAHSLRTGAICPDGTICKSDRQLLDYFALKATPDGRVASVWASTDDAPGKVVNVFGVTSQALLRAS
jgi:hypothetical protein